jgi:hypothetical protein
MLSRPVEKSLSKLLQPVVITLPRNVAGDNRNNESFTGFLMLKTKNPG